MSAPEAALWGPAGATQLHSFSLCAYAGEAGGSACGDGSDSSRWLQRNGDNSVAEPGLGEIPSYLGTADEFHSCAAGYGSYTVTVTYGSGETTAPMSACVPWTWQAQAMPGPR